MKLHRGLNEVCRKVVEVVLSEVVLAMREGTVSAEEIVQGVVLLVRALTLGDERTTEETHPGRDTSELVCG